MTTTTRSIYADPALASVARTRGARAARAARKESRREQVLSEGPARRLDRSRRLLDALWTYRARGVEAGPSPLGALAAEIESEVAALEDWAADRTPAAQRSGPVIRQALDFLRVFGRLSVMDFSMVPIEDRDHLVHILALEHRWCYAAAGTTRDAFKEAAGRTGAR